MTARLRPDTLPWSPEAEQSVLGALLLDNRAFDWVADLLQGRPFFDARHQAIYDAISAACVASRPADVVTTFEALQALGKAEECGGLAYLNELSQSVSSAANARRYAEIVREKGAQRELMHTADEALTVAMSGGDVPGKVDRITSMFGEIQRRQVRKLPRPIAEIALERIGEYEALERGEKPPGWRTHIPALNRLLNGGLRAGSLYILAARPGVGKSSFAQDLGIHLASDGLATLFLSQEMRDTEVADRGVASTGRVSYSALLTGKMDGEQWSRAAEAMERLAKLPFYVDDQAALSLQDIRFKAKSCKGLKVLVVDYLQLCSGKRRDGNRNSEIEEISRGLKTLAKELGIGVIALSQLNRDVERRPNRRPGLSDLRDSGAIEQDADVVAFLWPVREFTSEGRQVVGCGIDKNRQGRLGEFGLDFYGDNQRWDESTAEIRPTVPARKSMGDL